MFGELHYKTLSKLNIKALEPEIINHEKIDNKDPGCKVCHPFDCDRYGCSFMQYYLNPNVDRQLNKENSKKIFKALKITQCKILGCHRSLIDAKIYTGDTITGWDCSGMGFSKPQWIHVKCPKCGYGWSIWKLGVPRNQKF